MATEMMTLDRRRGRVLVLLKTFSPSRTYITALVYAHALRHTRVANDQTHWRTLDVSEGYTRRLRRCGQKRHGLEKARGGSAVSNPLSRAAGLCLPSVLKRGCLLRID